LGNELGNLKIAGLDKIIMGAMKKLRVKPDESLYIGDNLRKDLVGAKKAGMRFIYFGQEIQEYNGFKPDGFFSDYSELERVISNCDLTMEGK
jgi:FMN phosphatase YigB (HAD superfamily)